MFANTKILLNNRRILQLRLKTKPSGHHSVDNVVYCDNTTSRDLTLPVSVSEQIKSTWMRRVVSIAWDVIISNLCVDVGLPPPCCCCCCCRPLSLQATSLRIVAWATVMITTLTAVMRCQWVCYCRRGTRAVQPRQPRVQQCPCTITTIARKPVGWCHCRYKAPATPSLWSPQTYHLVILQHAR